MERSKRFGRPSKYTLLHSGIWKENITIIIETMASVLYAAEIRQCREKQNVQCVQRGEMKRKGEHTRLIRMLAFVSDATRILQCRENVKADNIRLYGDFAYIFCGETLVTVIRIPAGLRKDLKNMVKEYPGVKKE